MAMGSSYISDAEELLWLGAKKVIPGVKLGGIFANKRGYHNSRKNNQASWPGDYSIKLTVDKKGSSTLASAIDLTMSDTEMRKRTNLLRDSAKDPQDERLGCLREFIGTLDSKRVFCIIGGDAGIGQDRGKDDWSRDSSHLWHIHLSILRAYANDWAALDGVLSVLSGESLAAWRKRTGGSVPSKPSKPSQPSPAPKPHYDFPLPSGYYFGPKGGPKESVSGYYGRSFKGVTDRTWLQRWGTQMGKRGWSLSRNLPSGNDGFFGPEYQGLVRAFQDDQGLTVDGKLGPRTWRAAFENPVG